jgi:hypothetical protein
MDETLQENNNLRSLKEMSENRYYLLMNENNVL